MRKLLVLYAYTLFCLCSNVAPCEGGNIDPTNLLRITRMGGEDGPVYDYVTEWNRFPVMDSWLPGDKPFPLNLWRESEALRPLIGATKGITEKMALTWVRIHRFPMPDPTAASAGAMSKDMTNQWYVIFSWQLDREITDGNKARSEEAVVLLDGNMATRILVPDQDAGIVNSTNLVVSPDLNHEDLSADDIALLARVRRIQDQRRPLLSRVDLGFGSAAAAKHVTEHFGGLPDLKLEEIWLTFGLVKSTRMENDEDIAVASDWIGRYTFVGETKPKMKYEVDTLYDGTIVNAIILTNRY